MANFPWDRLQRGELPPRRPLPTRVEDDGFAVEPDVPLAPHPRKRRQVDQEALNSPLARLPGLDVALVRGLLTLGVQRPDDLFGRAPEVLREELEPHLDPAPPDLLERLRLAVYVVETPEPERAKLHPSAWRD